MRFLFRSVLVAVVCFMSHACTAQTDSIEHFDSDTIPFHWPYMGKRIPPFLGVTGGINTRGDLFWEAGVMVHLAEYYDENHARGNILGGGLNYKQGLQGASLKTIELEGGIYTPFTLGIGFNENFYDGRATFGFRPFIGTSWYHFQLMVGYNCYSKRQTAIGELVHFEIKLRYVIPVVRIFHAIPNPGNNY